MKGIPTRVAANMVWLVVFSAIVVVGAFLTFVTGVLFDDSYPIRVPMPEAGGVLPQQEVTVLGRAVGQVEDVALTREGVMLTLSIRGDQSVPANARVKVLRRSPIGEQAVDFHPVDPDWVAAEPGSEVVPAEAIVPAEVPFLLEKTVELFAAIDVSSVSTVIEELALALDDRGPTLKQLGRDALELNRTFVAGIPEFERAIESSDAVLTTLRDHRDALAEGFVNAADLTEILAEESDTVDRLLTTGERFVTEADRLIRSERANLGCLMRDLQSVNDMLLGPSTLTGVNAGRYESKLDEAEHALIRTPFFFQEGYNIIAQHDPLTGALWTRVHMIGPPEEGQQYARKTPTPPTRPGAACVSDAFGTGVDAVRQADHQPPDETSPGIEFAPRVEERDGDGAATPARDDRRAIGAAPAPSADLPVTGGGTVALTPLLLGAAFVLRRRP